MKPRLLDLFCGAGGCAKGYQDAGFYVVGVDIALQPNYCGDEFVQADALEVLDRLAVSGDDDRHQGFGVVGLDGFGRGGGLLGGVEGVSGRSVDGDGVVEAHGSSLIANPKDCALPAPLVKGFDAIHASPPCQRYSMANNIHQREDHPDLVGPTRELLKATGLPYVIENVPGAPLENYVVLCGLTFGLNVKRHRLFETNFPVMVPPCPPGHPGDWLLVFGHTVLNRGKTIGKAKGGGPRIENLELWSSLVEDLVAFAHTVLKRYGRLSRAGTSAATSWLS